MFSTRLLVLSSLLVFTPSVLASQGFDFKEALSNITESGEMVGLAVAVVRDGDVSFMQTYGVRELGSPDRITSETTFRIASLSKAFAATVAVQLDNENKLSLDSSATSFNQDFRLKSQTQVELVTLNHVLSHRLSLPPYAYDNLLEAGVATSTILREMKNVTPICKVGSCYAYQNIGFNMITPAIELADEQSYAASVTARIFEPLEMYGASLGKKGLSRSGNWARSYRRNRGQSWRIAEVKQAYYNVPAAGGINANLVDMSKWLVAQLGNSPNVLSHDVLARLHAPQIRTTSELRRMKHMRRVTDAYYGLGWRIYQYAGTRVVNHSGSVEGYAAQIALIPDKNVGIVLLTNSNAQKFWQILPAFLDHELGLLQDQ